MNRQAARRYVAQFYPARMTVFLSGDIPLEFTLKPKSYLHGMDAQHIDLRIVPGDGFDDAGTACGHSRKQLSECVRNARSSTINGVDVWTPLHVDFL